MFFINYFYKTPEEIIKEKITTIEGGIEMEILNIIMVIDIYII